MFSDLLSSKNSFYWTDGHANAFKQLKQALVEAPALILSDTSPPFYIATDASDHAFGAVLLQEYDGRWEVQANRFFLLAVRETKEAQGFFYT